MRTSETLNEIPSRILYDFNWRHIVPVVHTFEAKLTIRLIKKLLTVLVISPLLSTRNRFGPPQLPIVLLVYALVMPPGTKIHGNFEGVRSFHFVKYLVK